MSCRRRLLWACACGLILANLGGHANAGEAQEAAEILEGLRFPQSVQVDFVQRQLNPLLKHAATQSGTLWISPEDGLVMRVDSPRAEMRMLKDDLLTLERPVAGAPGPGRQTRKRQLRLDPKEGNHLVLLGIQALLLGDFETVTGLFDVRSTQQAEGWRLLLQPRAASGHLQQVTLTGEGPSLHHLRADYELRNGATSWMEIELGTSVSRTGALP